MFVAVTYDDVTTMDNQSWNSIHAYIVTNHYRESIINSLDRLTKGSSASRLVVNIVDALQVHGGLSVEDMKNKFLSFSVDKAIVFQVVIFHDFTLLILWCSWYFCWYLNVLGGHLVLLLVLWSSCSSCCSSSSSCATPMPLLFVLVHGGQGGWLKSCITLQHPICMGFIVSTIGQI